LDNSTLQPPTTPIFQDYLVYAHFERVLTSAASRPGPIHYFEWIVIAGLIPWTGFLWAAGRDAVQAMLREIARSGEGSFLAVLKTFGERAPRGLLSLAQPGVTLALDFPNRGERTLRLFERLDAIVREAGGRLYAAKDARMPRELFEAGYPRLTEFVAYRDPGISSGLSRRLMGR
jgi:hypothetical protein